MKNKANIIRITFTILLIVIITSCTHSVNKNDSKTILTSDTVKAIVNEEVYDKKTKMSFGNLEGSWFQTDYIDSTIKYRKIFDYIDNLSRDRYEITFNDRKPDTAYIIGYWEEHFVKLTKLSDSQYIIYGDTLNLVKRGKIDILEYIQIGKPKKLYSKRDLNITDVKKYFAKNIFSGKYHDIDRNKKVIFNDDFSITGIDTVTSYSLSDGISEYSDGMDLLSLKGLSDSFNWRFIGDTLILQKAISVEDENGPAGYKLGAIKFRLIRQD